MPDLPEITTLPQGAQFVRADLHVHCCAGSHDVKDPSATPATLVATAVAEGLRVLAIADHNEIAGAEAAVKAATGANLLVLPAVELSNPEGHLLCYLSTLEALRRFHAQLDFGDRGSPNSHCQNAMHDCLNKLHALGGFAVLAHVDGPSGLETRLPGATPHKLNILCSPRD